MARVMRLPRDCIAAAPSSNSQPVRFFTKRVCALAVCAAGLIAAIGQAGCSRPVPPEAATASEINEAEREYLWDATLSVLRKMEFQPDRQDRAQGIITTLPMTSKQWHEPWRQDVKGGYELAQASLHTIRRQVTVRFVREGTWRVDVQVDVYRLNAPESQITTASSAIQAFSGVLPTTEGTYLGGEQAPRDWTFLYRDGAMEDRILRRILSE